MYGSSNLKAQPNILCKIDEIKIFYVLFSQIKSKGKSIFFENRRGEGALTVSNLGLFFQS